jgi:uncharacterized alkaline shock family protein YloU
MTMTRFLHITAGICIWFLVVIMGGAMVYANGFSVEESPLGFFFFEGHRIGSMSVGAILILLALLYLVTSGRRRPRKRYISFESDSGTVSISINAVRDFIRKLGDEFGAVVAMDPKISSEKDRISIDLDVKIQTGSRIPELSKLLQDRVRESIRDGLGIVDVREIKVKVQEIVGAPPAAPVE